MFSTGSAATGGHQAGEGQDGPGKETGTREGNTGRTDAAGFASTTQYHYAAGAVTQSRRPSAGGFEGSPLTHATPTYRYDSNGRPQRVEEHLGFYTRMEYSADLLTVESFSNVRAGQPTEAYAAEIHDGPGRVMRTARYMPGQTTRYSGQSWRPECWGYLLCPDRRQPGHPY